MKGGPFSLCRESILELTTSASHSHRYIINSISKCDGIVNPTCSFGRGLGELEIARIFTGWWK